MDKGILVVANLFFLAFLALLAVLLSTSLFIKMVASIFLFVSGYLCKDNINKLPQLSDLKQV